MSNTWYYNRTGSTKRQGPVTIANLRVMVSCGQLTANDLLFEEGTQDWVPAGAVPGLFPVSSRPAEPASTTENIAAAAVADDPLSELGAIADGTQPATHHGAHSHHHHHHHPPAKQSNPAPIVIGLVVVGAGMGLWLMLSIRKEPPPAAQPAAPAYVNTLESRSAVYQKAYQAGLTEGQNLAKQWAGVPSGAEKTQFRDRQQQALASENDNINLMLRSYEPGSDQVQELKGHADGVADGMRQGGMSQ